MSRRSPAVRHSTASRSKMGNRILHSGELIDLAGGVAELLGRDTGFIEHGEQQVVHRRLRRVPDMPAALYLTRCASDQNQREIVMGVRIAIADAAAIENHGVVKQ